MAWIMALSWETVNFAGCSSSMDADVESCDGAVDPAPMGQWLLVLVTRVTASISMSVCR